MRALVVSIMTAVLIASAPATASSSCRPVMDVAYDSSRVFVFFEADLASCDPAAEIGAVTVSLFMRRNAEEPIESTETCSAAERCHVSLGRFHPRIENASYEFRWRYTNGGRYGGAAQQSGGCQSYIVVYGCPLKLIPDEVP